MTDPFAHDLAREAREQLYTSARRSMRYGAEPHDWLAHLTGAISMARTAARGVRNVSDCGTL